jgi:polysaccharide chain length determinant protein (PEP-CTERM system associated)
MLLAIARRSKWLLAIPFVIVTAGTFAGTRLLPNRYRSETLILVVPQRVPESYVKATVTSRIEDRLQSISQQILSRTRLERVIQDFNLYEKQRRTLPIEDIVEKMRTRDVEVQVVKGDAFRVSYSGEDPRTVMRVTESLASLFIEENLRDRAVLAEDSYQFLDSQLKDARRRLEEHEKKLEEYRRQFSGQLPSQLDSNLQMIQNTQLQIQGLTDSMSRDRDRRLFVERAIADATQSDPGTLLAAPLAAAAPGEITGGTFAQQLEVAKQALRQLELRLKPEHPDVVRMKRLVESLERKAEAEAIAASKRSPSDIPVTPLTQAEVIRQNRLKELRSELENVDRKLARQEAEETRLREVVRTYQGRVEATPTRESELVGLTRDYDTLQKTYTSLLSKKEDSKLAANLEQRQIGEQFKMLDPARLPERPFSPNRLLLNMAGALVGLGMGIAIVALLEFMDMTLQTDDDVVNSLSLPVLAVVPSMTTRREVRAARRTRLVVAAASSVAAFGGVAFLVWKLYS